MYYTTPMMGGGYPPGYPPQFFQPQQPQGYAVHGYPVHDFNSPYSPFPNPGMGGYGGVQQPIAPQPQPNQQPQQPVQQQAAFNPYASYPIPQTQQPQGYGYDPFAYMMNPPGGMMPYGGYGYGYNGMNPYLGYQQNMQYNAALNGLLYNENIPGDDVFDALKDVILSDREKSQSFMNTPIAYGYNGAPLFSNEQLIAQKQEQERLMEMSIQFCSRLSAAAHTATDDKPMTMEEARQFYDPKLQKGANPYQQQPNYNQMTRDQIEWANQENVVTSTNIFMVQFDNVEYFENLRWQRIGEGYAKIKESHDKLLGINEGDGLKEYLANAGLLYADALSREARLMQKDGTLKYRKGTYTNALAKANPDAVNQMPISMFTNDDYIPLEQRIKERYIAAKSRLIPNRDGTFSPSTPPPPVSKEVAEAREAFLIKATEGVQIT